ncbi:hypothetical protein D187_009891 [Cystobacter fuscus DSM 2262]|uniref:Uncharacterized protein n=2 Tax=Cystobacter fuscus TaxID=43 RepID=S9QZ88_CYSF2|nr:hypothetical protein D187_009891 [Cystobacter fuscus DSM 2262]
MTSEHVVGRRLLEPPRSIEYGAHWFYAGGYMIAAVLLALVCSTPEASSGTLPPEALGAPPQANALPTAWACTVDTLRAGRECIFESEVSSSSNVKEQASGNVRTLTDIGHALCTQAARPSSGLAPDKDLVAQCERRYSEAAQDFCGLEGKVPIIDAKGRFAPAARACYRQLSLVLQDISTMATVASACCQCAQKRGCPGAGNSCHENVSQQKLGASALACLSNQCGSACELTMPTGPASSEDVRSTEQARRPSRTQGSL